MWTDWTFCVKKLPTMIGSCKSSGKTAMSASPLILVQVDLQPRIPMSSISSWQKTMSPSASLWPQEQEACCSFHCSWWRWLATFSHIYRKAACQLKATIWQDLDQAVVSRADEPHYALCHCWHYDWYSTWCDKFQVGRIYNCWHQASQPRLAQGRPLLLGFDTTMRPMGQLEPFQLDSWWQSCRNCSSSTTRRTQDLQECQRDCFSSPQDEAPCLLRNNLEVPNGLKNKEIKKMETQSGQIPQLLLSFPSTWFAW